MNYSLSVLHARNRGLDMVKWIALITMVVDHLRFVWPDLVFLLIVGRLSFPFFCLAIAANVARVKPGLLLSQATVATCCSWCSSR